MRVAHSSLPMALPLVLAAAAAQAADGPPWITAVKLTQNVQEVCSMAFAPGDASRMFIVNRRGRIDILMLDTRTVLPEPFLDITDVIVNIPGETGLLDLKFDPDYDVSGHFYVTYSEYPSRDLHIARFTVSADPDVADGASEVTLKVIPYGFSAHNAGQLQFGPDGYLYASIGDGSTAGPADPDNNSQNLQDLHGKLLRLDVTSPPDYIPTDNPFVTNPDAFDEIWAYGLRNPWRFSFDRLTGDLYIGDVGRGQAEEINFAPASSVGGENYGWNCMESVLCTGFKHAGCTCNDSGLTLPILDIPHVNNPTDAVIGGYVYRGAAIPGLAGRYFHADYAQAILRSFVAVPDGGGGWMASDPQDHTADLNPGGDAHFITSFAEDPGGELYFCTRGFGGFPAGIYRIEPAVDCNENGVPDNLDLDDDTSQDCNGNFIPDECDIADGTLEDANGDGVPDICEVPGDTDGDGVVNVDDIIAVIQDWGPCPAPPASCPGDLDDSGAVNVDDLQLVIANWTT